MNSIDQNIEPKGLQSLVVWQKAMQFAVTVNKTILIKIPDYEKWALIDQLRRSTLSIPANIAEGYGRFYFQEGVRFAYIARGSLEESLSHLVFAHEMGYINKTEFDQCEKDLIELQRLLNGYINYLKKSKQGINEPGFQYQTHLQENK